MGDSEETNITKAELAFSDNKTYQALVVKVRFKKCLVEQQTWRKDYELRNLYILHCNISPVLHCQTDNIRLKTKTFARTTFRNFSPAEFCGVR